MRRGIGAIVTTAVALVGAAVVVANPVSVPQSDVRVPAVELSAGTSSSATTLDQAYINAIALDPTDTGPASALKRMLAELVTHATLLGGRAVEEVFDARTTISAGAVPPTPTAAWLPYPPVEVAPARALSGPAPAGLPAVPESAGEIDPVLRQALTSLADDVGYVGGQVVVAAVATSALVSAEPKLIVDTITALGYGDLRTAVITAITAVSAPVVAPLIVADAVNTVVRNGLVPMSTPQSQDSAATSDPVSRPATATGLRRHTAADIKAAAATSATNGATDLSDGNKAPPHTGVKPAALRTKLTAAAQSARASADRFGTAVGKALSPHATAESATSAAN
ncbi:hypothetical protein [Mycobacterium sp. DL592]|uniref:hypothetical protein n=1 Tax=Mycobacterium sp. DL592 TaxID=2675524 RepID=UPI0014217A4A|nr:hypothetical protein [Mycobacterium sp. DL592]